MGCSMDRCNDGVSLCCHGRKPTPNFTRIAHDMRAMAANWVVLCCLCTHIRQHCSRQGRKQPKDSIASRGDH